MCSKRFYEKDEIKILNVFERSGVRNVKRIALYLYLRTFKIVIHYIQYYLDEYVNAIGDKNNSVNLL